MKNRLFLVLMAMLIAFTAGCSGTYPSVKVEGAQDTSYVVKSNGGMSVQYGNYVYFVNGYRAVDNADGKQNVFGEVEQGGIYRAELIGTEVAAGASGYDGAKDFVPGAVEEISFKQTEGILNPYYYFTTDSTPVAGEGEGVTVALDDEDNVIEEPDENQPFRIDSINVQRVVAKSVSPDAEGKGGIYIFGDYIYYASRNDQRDKNGTVQTNRYDFFRTKVDGSGTQKIYTTQSNESTNVRYSFYAADDTVYLVVYEGTDLVSVKMGARRPNDSVKIAEDVTGVMFPTIDTYYKNKPTGGTIDDYIFFTRDAGKEDNPRTGVIGEMIGFDGKNRTEILSNPDTTTKLALVGLNSGMLYYTELQGAKTVLMGTDLMGVLTAEEDGDGNLTARVPTRLETVYPDIAGWTNINPFRNSAKNLSGEVVYDTLTSVFYVSNSKLMFLENGFDGTAHTIASVSAMITAVMRDYVYFTTGDAALQRASANINKPIEGSGYEAVTALTMSSASFFKPDVAAGYLFFLRADMYDWAPDYLYLKRVSDLVDEKEMFIGKIEQENPKIELHKDHDEDDHKNRETTAA